MGRSLLRECDGEGRGGKRKSHVVLEKDLTFVFVLLSMNGSNFNYWFFVHFALVIYFVS